jgi:hypothetical protein
MNASTQTKKVIFTMGGKGGTGKTTFLCALAEWFAHHEVPVVMLDFDIENKLKGSLTHFFQQRARKVDIETRSGLDILIDASAQEPPVILADMGAGSGKIAYEWFDTMYESVADFLAFTAVGVINSDPASVESVLTWAGHLQDRVSYLIVCNQHDSATFPYWERTSEAEAFRKTFHPAVVSMAGRIPALQQPLREHGLTLGEIAGTTVAELSSLSQKVRASAYRRQLFGQLEQVKEALLP